jgi:beta-mannosidase
MKRLNFLFYVSFLTITVVHAQQKKSMDEIDAASFMAGLTPFHKECVSVNLKEKVIKHVNAPKDIILDGEWQLVEGGEDNERLNSKWANPITAEVPGSVHTALWKAGIIPDPYFGRNDTIAEKNSYKTWWYKKEFTVDNKLNVPKLIFGGIANKSSVWLNGIKLGNHEGMFGGPSFDVSKILKDRNVLIVKIEPIPQIYGDDIFSEDAARRNWSYKYTVVFNCVYGWHYCKIPSLGIWRSVRIKNQAGVEIENPFVITEKLNGLMKLSVVLKSISARLNGELFVSVIPDNFKGNEQSFEYKVLSEKAMDTLNFAFDIKDPQLWWPNDMGKQNLYKLKISFVPTGKTSSDFYETTFGIRTIKMAPLPGGPYPDKYNWTFVINDKPHFVKGNGWCTMDPLMNFTRERYDRFLSLAKLQHIQMMRAWGCGMPETDDFYDLCDRYGILIIQEWPTDWNSHETQPYDVLKETIELTTLRIRNHPSLAMYGGGNESSEPFGKAIDMMGRISIELDGTRPFHRGEPWGGSSHNYYCWWGRRPLQYNLNMTCDFWGEFGIAALPVKESVLRYLPESEKLQWPPDSLLSFAHHTPVFGLAKDMERLAQYSGYFMPADNMDHFITGSQLAQVVGVRHTLERARTRWPECSGALYYKMNDNYPAASWSCVDWYGAPKLLHYFTQDAFSPVASVVLFDETNLSDQRAFLPVFLLDDNLDLANSDWKVAVRAFDQNLKEIKMMEYTGNGNQQQVNKLGEFSLTQKQLQTFPLLIVSEVFSDNKLLFRTFYYMNYESHKGSLFNLPRTSLSLTVIGNKATVKNTGKLPAVGVNIECPGKADKFTVSDNYFWLDPNESETVEVNIENNLKINAWNLEGTDFINTP